MNVVQTSNTGRVCNAEKADNTVKMTRWTKRLFILIISTLTFCLWYKEREYKFQEQPITKVPLAQSVFPDKDTESRYGDRIREQLDYRPNSNDQTIIFVSAEKGKEKRMQKLVDCDANCLVTNEESDVHIASIVVFAPEEMSVLPEKSKQQSWVVLLQESPYNTPNLRDLNGKINYTASYRWDSDFVSSYGRFVEYEHVREKSRIDHSKSKTKNVAWYVSHCLTNNARMEYANELGKHIDVDIFGDCGRGYRTEEDMRRDLQNDYRFYLAFENSNCEDYITEKFFKNALQNNVIPIVMGAPRKDYLKVIPLKSFIHVNDFQSPELLADYLHYLTHNRTAYNEYFEWKRYGRFEDSKLLCRICRVLHAPQQTQSYEDIEGWWQREGQCEAPKTRMRDNPHDSNQR